MTKSDRRAHWIETYVSSDDWDFGQWTAEFVRFGGEYLGQLIGVDMVAQPLKSMMTDVARRTGVDDRMATWRELLDEAMPLPESMRIWPRLRRDQRQGEGVPRPPARR